MHLRIPTLLLCLASAFGSLMGCASDRENRSTDRDRNGRYSTTSQYRSMERTPFLQSMRAALDDHDKRVIELERRAKELGVAKVETLSELTSNLAAHRESLKNNIMRVELALDADYPERRESAFEAFVAMRESLDEASEAVLGS